MPHLAALVCHSAFDLAIHDAFGQLAQRPVFETFGEEFLASDLGDFLEPRSVCGAAPAGVSAAAPGSAAGVASGRRARSAGARRS